MLKINKVVVIGGSGTVGRAVSAIFASFGNAKVYMVGRDKEKLEKARHSAALSVRALTVADNLIIKTFDELDECIKKADFVFESVSEDFEIKKKMHEKINKFLKKGAITATGSSGLSIDDLAECYDDSKKESFLGVHFFNPPYNLPLCEIIPSKYNSNNKKIIGELREYLEDVLLRNVVIVKNEPAFLGNRIGFMFLNEALQYADKYKERGGIDYIDSVLGCYTGRSMRPLETIDFVGLDVHKAIVDNVRENSKQDDKDSFVLPEFFNEIVSEGNLGAKTGCGLYKRVDDDKLVYDIQSKDYRDVVKYDFSYQKELIDDLSSGKYIEGFNCIKNDKSLESEICLTFLLKYIIYSVEITKEICDDISFCDDAMADGFNWLPPLAMIDILGGVEETCKLCKKYLKKDCSSLLKNLPKSKYDYRKFIKAKV